MTLAAAQCRAARALLQWSQETLATVSKVAKPTIANFETGNTQPYDRTLADVRLALEAAGVEFIPENGGGAGVRLRKDAATHAETKSKMTALHEEADAIDVSGPASPRKALNTMKQAIARNDAEKLKSQLSKKKRID